MIPPQFLAIGGGVLLLLGIVTGWTVRDWKADASELAATNKLIDTKDRMQGKVDAKAGEFEAFRLSLPPQREIDRTTIKEAYRDVPVPADCALRPDALRVLDDARERANAAATGQSGGAVPADNGANPAP